VVLDFFVVLLKFSIISTCMGLVHGHDSCPVTGHKSHEKGVQEPVISGNWLEARGYCT
jgi:hypothetical protein